jgi:hypothetical protein
MRRLFRVGCGATRGARRRGGGDRHPGGQRAVAGGVELGFIMSDKGKLQAARRGVGCPAARAGAGGQRRRDRTRRGAALAQTENCRSEARSRRGTIVEEGGRSRWCDANRDSLLREPVPPGGFTTRAEAAPWHEPTRFAFCDGSGPGQGRNLLDNPRSRPKAACSLQPRHCVEGGRSKRARCNRSATPRNVNPKRKLARADRRSLQREDQHIAGCSDLKDKICQRESHTSCRRHCQDIS